MITIQVDNFIDLTGSDDDKSSSPCPDVVSSGRNFTSVEVKKEAVAALSEDEEEIFVIEYNGENREKNSILACTPCVSTMPLQFDMSSSSSHLPVNDLACNNNAVQDVVQRSTTDLTNLLSTQDAVSQMDLNELSMVSRDVMYIKQETFSVVQRCGDNLLQIASTRSRLAAEQKAAAKKKMAAEQRRLRSRRLRQRRLRSRRLRQRRLRKISG